MNAQVINLHDFAIEAMRKKIVEAENESKMLRSECKDLSEEGIYLICEVILNEGITTESLNDMKEMIRIYEEEHNE